MYEALERQHQTDECWVGIVSAKASAYLCIPQRDAHRMLQERKHRRKQGAGGV